MMYSGDFLLKMDETPFKHKDWSVQENLALLEGVEMYVDQWVYVQERISN